MAGADVNVTKTSTSVATGDTTKMTPLAIAMGKGKPRQPEIVKLLKEYGAK